MLDPVILAFLLPTTPKRYCIQIFAARYFRGPLFSRTCQAREIKGTRKNGFYSISWQRVCFAHQVQKFRQNCLENYQILPSYHNKSTQLSIKRPAVKNVIFVFILYHL